MKYIFTLCLCLYISITVQMKTGAPCSPPPVWQRPTPEKSSAGAHHPGSGCCTPVATCCDRCAPAPE